MKVNKITGGYPGGFFLNDISFTIEEGKMYALLGLNGSGKTTILKMICGLLKTDSGSVIVNDRDMLGLKEKERAKYISYVPQQSEIVYDTSVIDVVLMGITPYLGMFETPKEEHIRKAYDCLNKFGIAHLSDVNFQTLSGGMKQIVIISRAMLQNGKYMILDEPDSSLDLVNKRNLMKQLRRIADEFQKGILISMHNPEYALNYCDSIILVKDREVSEIDLRKEDIDTIKNKLSEIYGAIEIIKYREKFMIYYE